jgi:exodeoxyribonuclease-3
MHKKKLRIVSWNVNSINARLETVLRWFEAERPDVACLQEIKCVDEKFPAEAFERLGYNVAVHGQKTYNGVALLSRTPLEDVSRGLPGDPSDEQARYIEAVVSGPRPVRVASIYLPNGNPAPGPKYDYKLAWMARMEARVRALLATEEPLVFCGDYNVIPQAEDAANPQNWLSDALYLPQTRAAYQRLLNLGLTDAIRAQNPASGTYTYWDFQAGAWERNNGIRIDHLLLSPQAADRLQGFAIDKHMRALEKPSDHVPIRIDLS